MPASRPSRLPPCGCTPSGRRRSPSRVRTVVGERAEIGHDHGTIPSPRGSAPGRAPPRTRGRGGCRAVEVELRVGERVALLNLAVAGLSRSKPTTSPEPTPRLGSSDLSQEWWMRCDSISCSYWFSSSGWVDALSQVPRRRCSRRPAPRRARRPAPGGGGSWSYTRGWGRAAGGLRRGSRWGFRR